MQIEVVKAMQLQHNSSPYYDSGSQTGHGTATTVSPRSVLGMQFSGPAPDKLNQKLQ